MDALEEQITALEAATPAAGTDESRALATLNTARSQRLALRALREQADSAAQQSASSNARIGELEETLRSNRTLSGRELAQLSLRILESRIAERQQAVRGWEDRATALQAQLREAVNRDLGTELAAARDQLSSLTVPTPEDDNVRANAAARTLYEIERALATERINFLTTQSAERGDRQAAARRELELLSQLIEAARSELAQLAQTELARTIAEADREAEEAERLATTLAALTTAAPSEALTAATQQNLELASELRQALEQEREAAALQERSQEAADRLTGLRTGLSEQLENTPLDGFSPARGAALLRQRERLDAEEPVVMGTDSLERELADARLRQFELLDASQAAWSFSNDQLIESLTLDAEAANRVRPLLRDLLSQQRRLIDRLAIVYAEYTEALALVAARREQLRDSTSELRELIDRNLLWSRNNEAISAELLLTATRQTVAILQPEPMALLWQRTLGAAQAQWFWSLLLILLAAALWRARGGLATQLEEMRNNVGRVQRDSYGYTLRALWLTLLLAMPVPLLLALPGVLALLNGQATDSLVGGLWLCAGLVLVAELLRQSLRPDGLAVLHLYWPADAVSRLRRGFRWFLPLLLLFATLTVLLNSAGGELRDNLGRIAFMDTLFAVIAGAALLLRDSQQQRNSVAAARSAGVIAWLIGATALGLLLLSMAGYQYAANLLGWRLANTGLLLIAAAYLYGLIIRALSISERRIALQLAREQRAALLANEQQGLATETEEGTINLDIDRIDLQAISAQSRALTRMVVAVLGVFAIGALWADFPLVFQPLQSVVLWDITLEQDGLPVQKSITLWHLIMAVLTMLVTVVGVRNIPGTLEVAVLNRLPLGPGTGYAITSVTSYLIVIAGVVIVLQLLGAQWSKLQWLVAALSVGLGFGLQEIVANFVSGLLILFERPVRLGDVVTIGDQTGVVTKIRIRATTVMDWDRREVLIPNKAFITERLINWTLTDAITRAIVYVGVAYGSDVELAEKTLHEIAEDNPRVLKDPPPSVLFLSFGDNALGFELRVFLAGLGDSLAARHELHKAIDARFKALGIEISFPQRDVHFDPGPLEIAIVDERRSRRSKPAADPQHGATAER
ncbi:MAG: mechanosensitive ion channel domain-containing protein [Pseudomonadota bacterium]